MHQAQNIFMDEYFMEESVLILYKMSRLQKKKENTRIIL